MRFWLSFLFFISDSGFALSLAFASYFLSEAIFALGGFTFFGFCILGVIVSLLLMILSTVLLKRAESSKPVGDSEAFLTAWSFISLLYSVIFVYLYIRSNGALNGSLSAGKYGYYCLIEVIGCAMGFFTPIIVFRSSKRKEGPHEQAI